MDPRTSQRQSQTLPTSPPASLLTAGAHTRTLALLSLGTTPIWGWVILFHAVRVRGGLSGAPWAV